ncbi:WcbI family polysaccharide biosynthesis putative acetyltransferase [Microbacterium hydrocarbonoxydans]|uniref:WcbI family polysaccharide biosynthesis putative acetyltransferase n=1 Tax=Microbacterium hydrocarbonoxydans TaxID=273678 RepID=UPI0020407F04|nr:WcbI family polysaccharide biosynthesis putative acetyltransferase [Microbacterium hydrocarbonoxydans]MCM3778319.1 WcbI family polysaccharide biosynthesis putative acetyltransferase [Microbacterium hydrocarbonoxydans]
MNHPSPDVTTVAPAVSAVLGRRRHYGEFYGLAALPETFGVVLGNCQAESLRLVMDTPERRFIRVPPVHEMTEEDARRLHELVPVAHTVVTQPVRDDYHDLPLGTRQVAAATPARVLTVPPVRFAGLHPFQAAIRVPGVEEEPPVVAYHDIRTLAAAAGIPVSSSITPEAVRAIGRSSVDTLRAREATADVRVSDLFDTVTADHARTVNHPGNAVWLPLAARVLDVLGDTDGPVDPGRPLLDAVRAPLAAEVVEAWDLPDEPRAEWIVEGEALADTEVREAHTAWYAAHPEFVAAAVDRLAPLLAIWRAA